MTHPFQSKRIQCILKVEKVEAIDMKKIMNNASDIVEEMIRGMEYTHDNLLRRLENTDVLVRKELKQGKVGIVSGGGSGHEPAHAGFVGHGLLDAAVCGSVFTSPTPDQILEAIQAVNTGAGVFLIIKNYSGDIMNFDMAKELAEMEDIKVEFIVVDDDIAVEDSTHTAGKRGVAGTVLVHKILGAAAEAGASLEEIKERADALIPNIKTLGLALSGATVPELGKPGFILGDQEIEFGVGIHGEPGYSKESIKPSKELAEEIINKLKLAFNWKENDRFGILVNGLGNTPLMELYVFMNDVKERLEDEELKIEFKMLGDYMTAIDMEGLSLSMIKIENDINLKYLNAKANTVAWKEF